MDSNYLEGGRGGGGGGGREGETEGEGKMEAERIWVENTEREGR